MARESYREDLEQLRGDVLDLGADVVAQLDRGLDALVDADTALANEVIESDEAINDRYLELESECIDLFALQQPVASDLRFIAASFKILTDLERIGDLATNLATYAQSVPAGRLDPVDVRVIGARVVEMVEDALAAYESGNAEACREIVSRDDEVDALCQTAGERIVRDLVVRESPTGNATGDTSGVDSWSVEASLDDVTKALLTVRDLERAADHAVNVAARTLYVVDSDPSLVY